MNPADFIHTWTNYAGNEKSGAKPWFANLCAMLGQSEPGSDPDYTYEKDTRKTGGGGGYADVWKKGHFAWEFKSRGANLDRAYQQLKNYAEDLENPPLLVVSDFDTIIVRTNFTNTPTRTHRIRLVDIGEPENLAILRKLWDDPESLRPIATVEEVTAAAANELGAIALALRERGVEPHRAAHFTVELLFCFFAEDIGLINKGLFSQLLDFGSKHEVEFNTQLEQLLITMRDGGFYNFHTIPRFNGGLFNEVVVEPLTQSEIIKLRAIARLDWGKVEPAIFGTLFERSLDPARRSQLGAHYTGVHDIDRVVEPVVMTPLRRRWDEVRAAADPIAADWQTARSNSQTAQATRHRDAFRKVIAPFLTELRAVTILDPACGSGNFLYVALRKLMDLEKEVINYAAQAGLPQMFAEVSPRQVLGLEINEYAVEITRTVVWIGYLQWRIANGFGVGDPVLEPLDTITLQDALLDLFDPENPKEAEWPAADYIIGNPPFLGAYLLRRELGTDYVDKLFAVYEGRIPQTADLCCYFFENARTQIHATLSNRAGLLATNSIRGGANREVLNRIKATGDIYLGWRDEPWVLAGANVRISIIGFDDGSDQSRILDGHSVATINSDLTATVDLNKASQLKENRAIGFKDIDRLGPFDISREIAKSMLSVFGNPNGRLNSDVVRPWVNATDVMGQDRGGWIIDFGVNMSVEEAAQYEAPFEFILKNVKPIRDKNRRQNYRERWWIHGEPRPGLRAAIAGLSRIIVTPHHSKHRIFTFLDLAILPSNALVVFARDDDFFFGLLHSRAHELWSLRMGTWIGKGNDPRYTATTCFETFPFPWPPGQEPLDDPRVQAIAAAAKALDDTRRRWLDPPDATEAELKKRTLTNLYNQRPTWLQHLHATLDRAVWSAYVWSEDEIPADVPEETILERLLALNLERSTK